MQRWPAESTNRSRSAHFGSRGLCLKCRCQSTYAIGAAPRGSPGCPDSAFWTASMASVRIVSTQSSSTDFRTMLTSSLAFSKPRAPGSRILLRAPRRAEFARERTPGPDSSRHGPGGNSSKNETPLAAHNLRQLTRDLDASPDRGSAAAPARGPLEWRAEDLDVGRRASLEWIEADGLGGFACGSASGSGLRRYHGWYSPPAASAPRKSPLVAGCEEHVWCGGETAALGSEPASAGEESPRCLARFALEPFPTWRYETDKFAIERSLCLVRG